MQDAEIKEGDIITYIIYAKLEGETRFGPWTYDKYKTKQGAEKALQRIKAKYLKRGKHTAFEIRKIYQKNKKKSIFDMTMNDLF